LWSASAFFMVVCVIATSPSVPPVRIGGKLGAGNRGQGSESTDGRRCYTSAAFQG